MSAELDFPQTTDRRAGCAGRARPRARPGEHGSPGGKVQVAPYGGRTAQTDPCAEKVLECGSHTAALPVEPIFTRERPEDFFNTLWLLLATIFSA